eukprot:CAMPEP_0170076240 /NCGR_PEP_ID=MMETSP0019_2-20121128/13242_1 /TAXON_ID=98059 /ORGANISM="Dinobryon sp., Strain UTEXLB2267" /LENGTH=300 /DNA_ID=CAMNT_0010287741 /DNA_START=21 /DNA_END=923 /DNA_ORIENTATION=+
MKMIHLTGRGTQEWPQMLQMTAQAGLAVLDGAPEAVVNKVESLYRVEVLLSQLKGVVWVTQKAMMDESLSKLYTTKGVMELQHGYPEVAKYNFKLALELLRSNLPPNISNYTSAGLLLSIAECYAEQRNTLSSLRYLELTLQAINEPVHQLPLFQQQTTAMLHLQRNGMVDMKEIITNLHQQQALAVANSDGKKNCGGPYCNAAGIALQSLQNVNSGNIVKSGYYIRIVGMCGLLYLKLQEYDRAQELLTLSTSLMQSQYPQHTPLMTHEGLDTMTRTRITEGLRLVQAAKKYYRRRKST